MSLVSLIAFALVFMGTSLALSLTLGTTVLALGKRMRRLGPWVERRAATGALLFPPVLAFGLATVLAVDSIWSLWTGTDHCLAHGHHLHLCLRHGAAWISQVWALLLVVFAMVFVGVRAVLAFSAHLTAQRLTTRLSRLGVGLGRPRCFLIPSSEDFAFTAGLLSPSVLISSKTWEALDDEQRAAVLAHEVAHLEHRDLRMRSLLAAAAWLGAPVVVARLLALWSSATERICDRRAATEVGRPSTVASAMLALARMTTRPIAPVGAVFAAASQVPERVQAVLDEGPGGESHSKVLVGVLAVAVVTAAAACVVFADPLHHVLETILG